MFEENMAEYTGAKYAVSCDNCTNALRMCCEYYKVQNVMIPARTYLSVPQSILQAGGDVSFDDYDWKGIYQLHPSYHQECQLHQKLNLYFLHAK